MKTIGRTSDFCLMLIKQVLILAHALVLDLKLAGRKLLFLKCKRWVVWAFGNGESRFLQINDIFS